VSNKICCACKKAFGPHDQVAGINERAVRAIESANPGLDLGSSVATDPAGNRRWVMCVACARKYAPGS